MNTSTSPKHPPFALVIGTFASTAYIHLQLEARRRLFPDVPLLVHDDASPAAGICRRLRAGAGGGCAGEIEPPLSPALRLASVAVKVPLLDGVHGLARAGFEE